MTDPLSIAESAVGIAAAGVKVSISLFALVETVSTASERVESIANDISSTCGILNQLRDLLTPQSRPDDTHTSIFNSNALSDISSTLYHCESIFSQTENYLEQATRQLKGIKPGPNSKIKLSRSEKAKWPFLQSPFDELRNDLRDLKTNLLLMVAVAELAVVQKQNPGRRADEREQTEMKATILRLQRARNLKISSLDHKSKEESENGFKRLLQKISFWNRGRKKELKGDVDDNKDKNNEKHTGTTVGAEQVTSNEAMRERRRSDEPFTETETNPGLLQKSTQYQQGSPEDAAPKRSEAINIDETKPSSPGTKANDSHGFLQAWTFSVLPGLSSGFGASLGIVELTLPEAEIRALLRKQEAQNRSPLKTLHNLNNYQRHLILAHIDFRDAKLLHVDVWRKESVPTVFGQLDIVTLVWITSSTEKREGPVDIETLFRQKETIPSEPKEPLNFKDAVGRKFTLPYHLVKSWKDMEELIKQAFLHVDVIGPHVYEGHYDLVGPDGQIILPQVWQSLVQPGWNVTMHMWPMPEISPHATPPGPQPGPPDPLRNPSPPPPPPALPVPPEVTVLPVDTLDIRESVITNTTKSDASPFFRWATGKSSPGAAKSKTRKGKPNSQLAQESNGTNRDNVVDSLLLRWTVNDELYTL